MKRDWENFSVRPQEDAREWTTEGLPVLRVRTAAPCPDAPGWDRIRRFYRLQNRAFLRFCRAELLPRAEAEGRLALESGREPVCFHADQEYRATYRAGRLWSLYIQVRETVSPGGASLLRRGDTWDLARELPVPVSEFFPPRTPWKRMLLSAAASEIERQEAEEISRFFPGWRRRLRRYWNPRNYYLTEAGLVLFYPMYALGPAAEGIPAFTLPWDGPPPVEPLR